MWTAGAIVLVFAMYLIDKHQKWSECWRIAKWLFRAVLGFGVWVIINRFTRGESFGITVLIWSILIMVACLVDGIWRHFNLKKAQ